MRFFVLCLVLLGCGGERRKAGKEEPEPTDNVTTLEGLPGAPCDSVLSVIVTNADQSTFCIDRFEASLSDGALGAAHQGGGDDLLTSIDGSTVAEAKVALDTEPATGVSWYQAVAACANAGKHLCTVAEWERACRGPEGYTYPYGDTIDDHACQGFFNYPENKPEHTGSLKTCGSAFGAFDLSGNVEEWTATVVERTPGTTILNDRAIRGGSFKSNSNALACVGPEFHAAPGSSDIDRGFRCCADAPPAP